MPSPNRVPDERSAAAIKVPGSGADTSPQPTKPAHTGAPQDERSSTTRAHATTAQEVRDGKVIGSVPFDHDFEVATGTPRSAAAERVSTDRPPGDETQPPAGPAGPSPGDLPQNIRVKYRGEDREYSLEAATNMIQQHLMNQSNGPVVALAEQLKQKTGIQDPAQIAQLIVAAINKASGGQPANPAAPGDPGTMARGAEGAAKAANVAAGAATPPIEMPPELPNAEAVVDEWAQANGMQLPDDFKRSMVAMVGRGNQIETMARTYSSVLKFMQTAAADLQRRSSMAMNSAVNAEAARVAQELEIDTPEEVAQFSAWTMETDKVYPGFKKRILSDPAAMGTAVRTFFEVSTGRRAIAERKQSETKVNADLVRAGGDMVTPRPGGAAPASGGGEAPPTAGVTDKFNQDLMSRM